MQRAHNSTTAPEPIKQRSIVPELICLMPTVLVECSTVRARADDADRASGGRHCLSSVACRRTCVRRQCLPPRRPGGTTLSWEIHSYPCDHDRARVKTLSRHETTRRAPRRAEVVRFGPRVLTSIVAHDSRTSQPVESLESTTPGPHPARLTPLRIDRNFFHWRPGPTPARANADACPRICCPRRIAAGASIGDQFSGILRGDRVSEIGLHC